MNKMNFVVDEELNNEINYWVQRKGWNENKIIVTRYSEEYEEECDYKNDDCIFRDCQRCTGNHNMSLQRVEVSTITSKQKIVFERQCEDKIGHIWGNWYKIR